MKLILILTVGLAAISSCVLAHGFSGHGGFFGNPPGPLTVCIQNKIKNNSTILSALVTALNNAGLSQFVNGTTVDFRGLDNYLFTAIPALSQFINDYILTSWPQLAPAVNATQNVISNLKNDVDTRNVFAGHLLIRHYNYVSGSVNSFTIDFAGIQANATTARFLNEFIAFTTRDMLYPRVQWGIYGHF